MTNSGEPRTDDAEDAAMAQLLRLAGPRLPVPPARAARVRAAVHAEWQLDRRRRTVRRRLVASSVLLAAAAVLVLAIGYLGPFERRVPPPEEMVAVVERTEGTPSRLTDSSEGVTRAVLARNDTLHAGDWIETNRGTRVALRFADGTSVRLDVSSRARPLSRRAIELSGGAVYVDTGDEAGRFEVRTALAIARDVGTQFEVRLIDRAVRLRVRSGLVELEDGDRSVPGRPGTEVTLSVDGVRSRPMLPYGPEWDWAARLSPPLDIEGLTLSTFLARIAREHGWQLRYADPALAREASHIVLHGSVRGLEPRAAVDVAVATSGLRHRLAGGELIVLRGPQPR